MDAKIFFLTAKHMKTGESRVFRFDKKRIVIGSATSNDVSLSDDSISPVHAIIEVSGPEAKPVVYDLASDSGLTVNGSAQVQATLNPDDKVHIGAWVLSASFRAPDVEVKPLDVIERPVESSGAKPSPSKPVAIESLGQRLYVREEESKLIPLIRQDGNLLEIFDRRSEAKDSLQVVMFFGNAILDVEHFVDKKRIVIGPGRKDDFSVPPYLGSDSHFALVTQEGSESYLHLDPRMKGVVSREGQLVQVEELVKSAAGEKVIPLKHRDFAKVKLGDVSFFLNHVPAPPKLKKPKLFQTDPFFFKVWLTSIAVTGLLVVGMSQMQLNPQIEIEQLPERVATIIYEPKFQSIERPKQEPTEAPKTPVKPPEKITITPKSPTTEAPKNAKIGQESQNKPSGQSQPNKKPGPVAKASGQEGAGAKAHGNEGTRGKQNAKKADVSQTKAARPGEGKKTGAAASNKGHSQTDDLGMVDVFKNQKGTLSKVLEGGKGLSNNADKLEGYSGFTTQGAGGLGAAGTGSGGGGESMGLGGLTDKGAGGGKKGTGLGALGTGGNILGGKGKLTIEGGGGGEPIVMGAIDTDAIMREINKHRDEIKYCYEKEINADTPDLAGKVNVHFVIGASGTVTSSGIASTTLKNAHTEQCVVEVIRRIQFPPVKGGGIAEVTVPFVFKPANK